MLNNCRLSRYFSRMDNNTNNIDDFFQGKIKLLQTSYKATSDAVFLGAAVDCRRGGKILDVGTGNGAVAVIAAYHNPLAEVTGIDINDEQIANAAYNAELNGLSVRFLPSDIKKNPLKKESFDIVVSNPPFFKKGTPSKSDVKKLAHHEDNITMTEWVGFCVRRTKYQGYVYLLTDNARVPEIIAVLSEKCGGITLFPLYAKSDAPPRRFIIRARKESREPFALARGLILHDDNGGFTAEANAVLRDGNFLRF